MTNETKAHELASDGGEPAPAAHFPPHIAGDRRVWQSLDLLGAENEALIVHRGQTYRLRCTKQGKLLLYK